jgi:hypothetical protein
MQATYPLRAQLTGGMVGAVDPTDLLGDWRLARRVLDRRTGQFGRVTGSLELTVQGSIVRWVERGELAWAGSLFEVSRELHIVPHLGGWNVCFSDGRLFHPWRPGGVVEHPCAADVYRGLIVADSTWTRLRVLWDVTGPTKQQRIVTRCVRSVSPAASGPRGARHPRS